MTKIEKNALVEAWTKAWVELKAARYRSALLNCERGCGYHNACAVVNGDFGVVAKLNAWCAINELCETLKIETPFCEQAYDLQDRLWRYAEGINPDE